MGKPFAMYALCIISAAFGAAIDHYLAGAIEQSGPHLERAVSSASCCCCTCGAKCRGAWGQGQVRLSIPRTENSCDRVSVVQTQVYGR